MILPLLQAAHPYQMGAIFKRAAIPLRADRPHAAFCIRSPLFAEQDRESVRQQKTLANAHACSSGRGRPNVSESNKSSRFTAATPPQSSSTQFLRDRQANRYKLPIPLPCSICTQRSMCKLKRSLQNRTNRPQNNKYLNACSAQPNLPPR